MKRQILDSVLTAFVWFVIIEVFVTIVTLIYRGLKTVIEFFS